MELVRRIVNYRNKKTNSAGTTPATGAGGASNGNGKAATPTVVGKDGKKKKCTLL